jgi:hypothetical protein
VTGGQPLGRVLLVVAAGIVGLCALAYASVPFATTGGTIRSAPPVFAPGGHESPDGMYLVAVSPQSSCGAALIDAWHAKSPASGWFGYAPLTDATAVSGSRCRAESQHRLLRSGYAILAALVLVAIARRGGRPGFGVAPAAGAA